jgi:FkbH-like protein
MTDLDERALRESIEKAITDSDAIGARNQLRRLWGHKPGPALAGFVVSRFERLREALAPTRAKVFVLRSCTVEPVVPVLRAASSVRSIDLDVQVGDFNAYAQEILNPESPLYRFSPDIVLLAAHTADVAPELWDGFADLSEAAANAVVERVLADFGNLIRIFRSHSQAHLVLHGLELPAARSNGVLDAQGGGQAEALRRINAGFQELARAQRGVYVLDYDGLVARHGRDAWYDARKWLTMHVPLRADRMAALADEWMRFIQPLTGRVCKALVVDLDNTLWGGVIGEDGMQGIKLGKEYPGAAFQALQRAILDLHQRGIILAICSKNNAADALEALEHHEGMLLRPAHFAVLKINWEDKARNLRAIAAELNIGIDSLAFIDDNPAERELVQSQVPEVTVIDLPEDPMAYAGILRACTAFERLTLSAEDRERGRYYAEERQRSELQQQATSLPDFYRSLSIRANVSLVNADTVARTSQLTQKTNQFNLTTFRYSEQQIQAMAADPTCRVYTVHTGDRFGDNGLVGVAITRLAGADCELDTLLLSCRVIGRTIETAILAKLCADARVAGATRMLGRFITTKKNAPSREFFPSHAFSCIEENATESRWLLDLATASPECPPWIDCNVAGSE